MNVRVAMLPVVSSILVLFTTSAPAGELGRSEPEFREVMVKRGLTPIGPERPGDAPASAPVLSRRTSSAGGPVIFGKYVHYQVNVDEFGNNIVGDAANEPSIAIDPTDPTRMAIGWRQFDSVTSNFRQAGWAYSTDRGQSWTFPGVLEPGRFRSDPVLGFDAAGNFYYSSLAHPVNDPKGFEVTVYKSTDGGATWPQEAHAFGGDKQWIHVDDRQSGIGAGHIYQSWTSWFSCCGLTDFTRSTDGGSSFEDPLVMPSPQFIWGTLDSDSDGVLYLAGAALGQFGHVFSKSLNAKDPSETPDFGTPRPIDLGGFSGGFGGFSGPNPDGLLGQVWIAAHPGKAGRVYVLASVGTADLTDVMFIRSVDDGEHWSPPVRVNDDAEFSGNWQWFGTMSVAPNGRIDAIWNDTRNNPGEPNYSAVFYSFSMDEGQTWSPNEQISPVFDSHVGFPNQFKIGDYYHMISDDGGANLAYAATFNGEQDVYFVRISQDCNKNGIEDACELDCSCSPFTCKGRDCNENNVPDECEPNDDCNDNSWGDKCEIAAHPELDCNSNRMIDSCEDGADCNANGAPDICDLYIRGDCNGNRQPDDCDTAPDGESQDRNENDIPDECEGSCCDCFGCRDASPAECFFSNHVFGGTEHLCGDAQSCAPPVFHFDDCGNAEHLISATDLGIPYDSRCASDDGPAFVACPSFQPFGADLWYTYTAPCDGFIEISTCEGTFYDAMIAVYGGAEDCVCPGANAAPLTCGDDTCGFGGGPAYIDLPVEAGACYTVRVGGWAGSAGSGQLNIYYVTYCEPTDFTGDGLTDLRDFAEFQNCFGPVVPGCESSDINHDGNVGLQDYFLIYIELTD